MRTLLHLVLYALFIAILATSAFCELKVTRISESGEYAFDWSGCTLAQALEEAHSKLGLHTVAMLCDGVTPKPPFQVQPSVREDLPHWIGSSYGCDTIHLGLLDVLTPGKTTGGSNISSILSAAQMMTAAQFVASLTAAQLATHKAKGGIPVAELTDQQKQYLRYCVTTWKGQAQFPELELSKRLAQAKAIVAVHPKITYTYEGVDANGRRVKSNSGLPCDQQASNDLWKSWGEGQQEAAKMAAAAGKSAAQDAPGNSSECELCGVYRLSDLLKTIKEGSGANVRSAPGTSAIKIAAHCQITRAALARALAATTGMAWSKQTDGWVLAGSAQQNEVEAYYSDEARRDYDRIYNELKPKLKQVVLSGSLRVVADPPWLNLTSDMLSEAPITFNSLTPEQKEHLRQRAEENNKYALREGFDLVASLPSLNMRWDSRLKLYVATDNTMLYAEWLEFN